MNNYTRVIIEMSKNFLNENPYDEGHDLNHHLEVWENAKEIVKKEQIQIDSEILHIVCMWHDVITTKNKIIDRDKITRETALYLTNLLHKYNFPKVKIEKIKTAIINHHLTSNPESVEGKILFDADKLEFLNLDRWKRILNATQSGKISKIKFFFYKRAGKYWLKRLKGRYYFETTRLIHDQKVQELINNPEAQRLANNMGENLSKILH